MIYAVNKRTKEHRLLDQSRTLADQLPPCRAEWKQVGTDADGWIPHDGPECPLPDGAKYDARTRSGKTVPCCEACSTQRWDYAVAYRPALEAKPEAPEWDGGGERPPAGSVCMLRNHSKDAVSCPAVVEYMSEQSCVWSWRDDVYERTMHAHPSELEFRPIRSEEDRAVEAMMDAIQADGRLLEEACRALYRAIKSGELKI